MAINVRSVHYRLTVGFSPTIAYPCKHGVYSRESVGTRPFVLNLACVMDAAADTTGIPTEPFLATTTLGTVIDGLINMIG